MEWNSDIIYGHSLRHFYLQLSPILIVCNLVMSSNKKIASEIKLAPFINYPTMYCNFRTLICNFLYWSYCCLLSLLQLILLFNLFSRQLLYRGGDNATTLFFSSTRHFQTIRLFTLSLLTDEQSFIVQLYFFLSLPTHFPQEPTHLPQMCLLLLSQSDCSNF